MNALRFITFFLFTAICLHISGSLRAQPKMLDDYNVVWNSSSSNSGASMPCGGGDIGLNVWVEKGELHFYVSRSGTFDENNTLLKLGRIRVKLSPNPFMGDDFRQELILKDGNILITGSKGAHRAQIRVWVDVFRPVVHVDVKSNKPVVAETAYESWRYKDRRVLGKENNANSYKWAPRGAIITRKDEIGFDGDKVLFYHRNLPEPSVFDLTVKQQGLDSIKHLLFNPLKNLTFGGLIEGKGMKAAGTYEGTYLDTDFKGWKLVSGKATTSTSLNLYLHTAAYMQADSRE